MASFLPLFEAQMAGHMPSPEDVWTLWEEESERLIALGFSDPMQYSMAISITVGDDDNTEGDNND